MTPTLRGLEVIGLGLEGFAGDGFVFVAAAFLTIVDPVVLALDGLGVIEAGVDVAAGSTTGTGVAAAIVEGWAAAAAAASNSAFLS